MRASPFALSNPKRQRGSASVLFADPDIPGAEFSLTFRHLKGVDLIALEDVITGYVARYVTGMGPVDEKGNLKTEDDSFVPPEPLPAIDNEPVTITATVAKVLATLEYAQVGEDPMLFVEMIGWLHLSDVIAARMVEMYRKLTTGANFDPPAPSVEESSASATAT